MSSSNYYNRILKLLGDLKISHPNYNIGKHLATSLDDIELKNVWGMSDETLYEKIKDYQISLELDVNHDDSEIEKILKDGMHLNDILNEESDDEDNFYLQ
jgi:hypothetical protein